MMALDISVNKYSDVSYEEKERLFEEAKADARWDHILYGCYDCGICVAACPSARFYDFSPRLIAQAVSREDVDLVYTLPDTVTRCKLLMGGL